MKMRVVCLLGCLIGVQNGFAGMNVDQIPDMPVLIKKLLAGPSAKTISERSVPYMATNVIDAVSESEKWIGKVIDKEWLPEKWTSLCIDNEFEGTGTIRHEWIKSGYSFKVFQTKNSFTLVMRPEIAKHSGISKESPISIWKNVCLKVFAKTGGRRNSQGETVPIPEFNKKLADHLFDSVKTVVTDRDSVLSGRPGQEYNTQLLNSTEFAAMDSSTNVNWYVSQSAWAYWFRHIYWVADNEQIIVYFKKVLPSATGVLPDIHVSSSSDAKWFK